MPWTRVVDCGRPGGDGAAAGGEVQADGAGRGRTNKGCGRGRGKGKKGGWWERGPATGEMTILLAGTLGPSGGVAAGRTDSGVLVRRGSFFLKCFASVLVLVASSLLVSGQSSGS